MKQVHLITDGACLGNPGPGGWAYILRFGEHTREMSGSEKHTTNNRMELMGVIAGLEALKRPGLSVTVYSDSQYIVKAIKEGWLNKWIATNFAKGKKNKDLWVRFYDLYRQHQMKFVWVKGHADNPYNNRCDILATTAADGRNLLIDEGYEMDADRLTL